jgi:hypothetical protein
MIYIILKYLVPSIWIIIIGWLRVWEFSQTKYKIIIYKPINFIYLYSRNEIKPINFIYLYSRNEILFKLGSCKRKKLNLEFFRSVWERKNII